MRGGWVALGLALAAGGCAAKPKASEAPSVWVPREDAGDLPIDMATSNVRSIHMPRGADAPAQAGAE